MAKQRIRPLAICVFHHQGRILASEGFDPVKQSRFFRPLGGGIEFGETSQQALVRELREELDEEVCNLRLLGTLENLFVFNGEQGHEIVQVYDGEFANRSLYGQAELHGIEAEIDEHFVARWLAPGDFSMTTPLYPDGLLELLSDKLGFGRE